MQGQACCERFIGVEKIKDVRHFNLEQSAKAVRYFQARELGVAREQTKAFDADEIVVPPDSPWVGRTLEQLDFPGTFGVTVIGIRRGPEQITSPRAADVLEPHDSVIVVGDPDGVSRMKS